MSDKRPPTVIYLPSSGGHTSSRIVSESEDRRRFRFRRYSFDEDSGLVVRTRNVSRDNRTHPYEKHPTMLSTPLPRNGSISAPLDVESPQLSSSLRQGGTAELLKALLPALIHDPTTYEESLSSICAAHNVDPSVVLALRYAVEQGLPSRPLERQRTLDLPTSSLHNPASSSTVPVVRLTPHRHERAFLSGPRGSTVWYSTESYADMVKPPAVPATAGHIYIHTNMSTMVRQVWFYDANACWVAVTDQAKTVHPTLSDRVLNIRRARLVKGFEAAVSATNSGSSSGSCGRGAAISGPSHPAFYRGEDSRITQLEEDHRLLKKGFIKLREQHLEAIATATATEARLKSLQEDHALLVAKDQDLDGQIQLVEQRFQDSQARVQAAEQKSEETEIQLRESEHRAREVEARLQESERRAHDADQRVADAAHNLLRGLAEGFKCGVCLDLYTIPYRHMFCGPCLLQFFNDSPARSCPECRAACRHEPKREFVLQSVLSLIFQAQNRAEPTPASETFDTDVFAQMWLMAREERRNRRLEILVADQDQLLGAVDLPIVVEDDMENDMDIQMGLESDESDWGPQAGDEESDEEL
ncbi:hypothetical protein BJ322DRAFT_1105311 [Thelephora terrestris]|uniref:RING-type domain-containing protein n=1 Tax=Thelephora terrestris TaxID=56493 RepID=A0A9P6HME1_9AGAM|nr:hypothetical protein BJ322DRAFT_1105311 [Thelephora terrestris]